MSDTTQAILVGVFTLASCIWVGGYVAIAVVARTAVKTLDVANRVVFFRSLGRSYLRVGTPALAVALGTGACLLSQHAWTGTAAAAVAVAAALVACLAIGVAQARRMTRLRTDALADPENADAKSRVARGASEATILRAAIGLLSFALIALGAVLVT